MPLRNRSAGVGRSVMVKVHSCRCSCRHDASRVGLGRAGGADGEAAVAVGVLRAAVQLRIARALAGKLPGELRREIELVVSPAMGGVIIGHEMGRALGKPAMFLERPDGVFELRRGFRLEPGARVRIELPLEATDRSFGGTLRERRAGPRRERA